MERVLEHLLEPARKLSHDTHKASEIIGRASFTLGDGVIELFYDPLGGCGILG